METPPTPSVIQVPILQETDAIYHYVAIRGSLHAYDCSIFGLNNDELLALSARYTYSSIPLVNGVFIKTPVIAIVNALAELGYKVVCATGETEITWTMQREI